jgi:hypothetical protein
MSETINYGTLTESPPTGNDGGSSKYGTWGALGTVNGGESVSF